MTGATAPEGAICQACRMRPATRVYRTSKGVRQYRCDSCYSKTTASMLMRNRKSQ